MSSGPWSWAGFLEGPEGGQWEEHRFWKSEMIEYEGRNTMRLPPLNLGLFCEVRLEKFLRSHSNQERCLRVNCLESLMPLITCS